MTTFSWKAQPYSQARYTLFAAEVASNFNQAMVRQHLFRAQPDAEFQVALIEEALANFHRYFFIMPTLARFEQEIHARVEAGRSLSAPDLNTLMADLLAEASQEWIKAVGHATQVGLAASRAETEDFLTAIDRVAALEHQADATERTLAAMAVQHAKDFRQLHLFTAVGGKLEAAADALKHASLMLRDHVLETVIDA